EFTEYRQYSPGDDPRYLDWRLYARTDRYYIKKFEDETNLRCYLLVDNSRSMDYGTIGYTKAQYGNTLAATLAHFLSKQGDAVGLLTFDEKVREYRPARNRPGHLRNLMVALERAAEGASTDLSQPLKRIVDLVTRRGLMVLISDLLAPIDTLEKSLGNIRACGHEMMLFHLLDPAEVNFTFDNSALYRDMENDKDLYIDPAVARLEYMKKLEAHQTAVRKMCEKLGIAYEVFNTERPLELALFDLLRARMEWGKGSKRLR
ncbi:MAG TPA: DUF58 domain-containing protein, partial [Verrucomicrobiae bacterium]